MPNVDREITQSSQITDKDLRGIGKKNDADAEIMPDAELLERIMIAVLERTGEVVAINIGNPEEVEKIRKRIADLGLK